MKTGLRRRDFLRQGALLGAATVLSGLPPVIKRALAIAPFQATQTLEDVKHVVILMQENRSFDHYFGTLRGVRGFGDRFPAPLASGKSVWFESNGNREITPFRLDSASTNALLVSDTPHTYPDSQAAWNQGSFGEWPRYKTDLSMGYYQRDDIPFQYALAEAFTLCDAYHCSLTTCTGPNRVMFFSGSNADPALLKQGINSTDENAAITNIRCAVSGQMPSPGYAFKGSAFPWPTLPDLLEAAGVSWRIYQNPNDNFSGLMHGGLAFESFRQATAGSGSPLYEKGMQHWSLDDLRKDVVNGTLPSVSWILPSQLQSEHPATGSSPPRAGDFIANVLDALTTNAASWSKTALFITFDENDGFFDHALPPAVPSYNPDGTLAGASTLPLDGEYFSDPTRKYILPSDTASGTVRPWGLGARVPLYVISPWSRGGWVNSQVHDHTSMAMFLEKRFGITVDAISPWHRAVCGDLTSAFDFTNPSVTTLATLPDVSNYTAIEAVQRSQPAPQPPSVPGALYQEAGTRNSRALPYELHTSARTTADGILSLILSNSGAVGAVYHVYDLQHLDRIPRRYTVEAGKQLADSWDTTGSDNGNYQLQVYGPNGYFRGFQGNTLAETSAGFNPEIQVCYEAPGSHLYLKVHNTGAENGSVTVQSNAYRADGPWTIGVVAKSVSTFNWDLSASGFWYDFTVISTLSSRRFAGRMETGKDSISDPAMAQHF